MLDLATARALVESGYLPLSAYVDMMSEEPTLSVGNEDKDALPLVEIASHSHKTLLFDRIKSLVACASREPQSEAARLPDCAGETRAYDS
jgi:hypothetical protein